jgi:hypothetical protein
LLDEPARKTQPAALTTVSGRRAVQGDVFAYERSLGTDAAGKAQVVFVQHFHVIVDKRGLGHRSPRI